MLAIVHRHTTPPPEAHRPHTTATTSVTHGAHHMHTTMTVEGQQTPNGGTIEDQRTDNGATADPQLRNNGLATVGQWRDSSPATRHPLIRNTRATDPQKTPQRGTGEAQ